MSKPDIDYGRVADLLNAVEQITKVAPKSVHILGMAMEEIKQIDETAQAWLKEDTEAKAAAKRDEDAKRVAAATAENEANQPKAVPATTYAEVGPDSEPTTIEPVKRRV